MFIATRIAELKSQVDDFCKEAVDDFVKNKNLYIKQHGYRLRVEAVRLACIHMEQVARTERNNDLASFYTAQKAICEVERNKLADEQRW